MQDEKAKYEKEFAMPEPEITKEEYEKAVSDEVVLGDHFFQYEETHRIDARGRVLETHPLPWR